MNEERKTLCKEEFTNCEIVKENQQLKKANEILKENAIHNDKVVDDTNWKIKQYKSVLDEIREYINKNSIYFATKEKVGNYFANCSCDDLLQILDKVDKE